MRIVKEGEQLESCGKVFGDFIIVKIFSNDKILVEFVDTGYQTISYSRQVQSGCIRDGYVPTVQGIGYIGQGEFDKYNSSDAYYCWIMMLRRAYDEKYHKRQPTYKNVTVCKEWHNFQNFAEWFDSQEFDIGYNIDKDLLKEGNKIYCEEYCTMIPGWLNRLFPVLSRKKESSNDLPANVERSFSKKHFGKFQGYGWNGLKRVRKGWKCTVYEAEIDSIKIKIKYCSLTLKDKSISDNIKGIIFHKINSLNDKIKMLENKI